MDMSHYRKWVGDNYADIGRFQFRFITEQLLVYSPDKTFLDVGCGSLRLGHKLIKHHGAGKYIGLDVSQELINYGLQYEINPIYVEEKKPRFIVNSEFDYSELGEEKVDIAWSYAVWMHLPDHLLRKALINTRDALKDDGVLFSGIGGEPNTPHNPRPDDDYVYDQYQRTFFRWEEEYYKIFTECGLSFEHRADSPKGGYIIRSVKL